jgi:hypothetical protein
MYLRPFDTIIEINTLHHISGDSVPMTYANLERFFAAAACNLEPNGKAVLIESTVPRWFLRPYKLIYPALLKFWPCHIRRRFNFIFATFWTVPRAKAWNSLNFARKLAMS